MQQMLVRSRTSFRKVKIDHFIRKMIYKLIVLRSRGLTRVRLLTDFLCRKSS